MVREVFDVCRAPLLVTDAEAEQKLHAQRAAFRGSETEGQHSKAAAAWNWLCEEQGASAPAET